MPVPYDVIKKKRDGKKLTREEIEFMVGGFSSGELPDYQMAAFLMSIFFSKMDHQETAVLTQSMQASGKSMDLSSVPGATVDKHSTGGVGDKVSLPLAPLVAACGGYVPMMSGRGLGHTGGTLDKLEAIPGFRVQLEDDEFVSVVKEAGCAIVGQTSEIAPADKKMYALRDVTATVDSMDLIAASILSKKLAAGPQSLILDVKTGSGAFMQNIEDSRALAELMVGICRESGRNAQAIITNMHQPLGIAAGNATEVAESIAVLKGEGPKDLTEITLVFGARMLIMAGLESDPAAARSAIESKIQDGSGLERFRKMIELQGADPNVIDNPGIMPQASGTSELIAEADGTFLSIDTQEAGMSVVVLGGGRQKADDDVDHAVGIDFVKKPGDKVSKGEPLAIFHYNDETKMEVAKKRLSAAIQCGEGEARISPLLIEEIN
ncbi:MAG: thymidine phosphorylase [Candidatus Lindowbacteria bacterium]|nr:thymidine phosphorylase [Candidatus Lindowbacteria bacterium]